jgi:hypothetical protein
MRDAQMLLQLQLAAITEDRFCPDLKKKYIPLASTLPSQKT